MTENNHLYSFEYNQSFVKKNDPVLPSTIDAIIRKISNGMPKLLGRVPYYDNQHIRQLESIADCWNTRFEKVIVVAMGGAMLNSLAITNFIGRNYEVKILFADRVCKEFLDNLSESLSLCKTGFVFISNSGNTIEVVTIAKYFHRMLIKKGIFCFHNRFIFIHGGTSKSLLSEIHNEFGGVYLPYDSQMGGRFSTFTTPHILIGMLAGFDYKEFFTGANHVLNSFMNRDIKLIESLLHGAGVWNTNSISVINCSYSTRLDGLMHWHSTALAETLGKEGLNITPSNLKLPLDQHGLLQAVLVNKTNQFVNMFSIETYLSDDISNVSNIMQSEVCKYLDEHSVPSRRITLKGDSIASLGAVMMHLMLETIAVAVLVDVEPFTQPQIDSLKRSLADRYREISEGALYIQT